MLFLDLLESHKHRNPINQNISVLSNRITKMCFFKRIFFSRNWRHLLYTCSGIDSIKNLNDSYFVPCNIMSYIYISKDSILTHWSRHCILRWPDVNIFASVWSMDSNKTKNNQNIIVLRSFHLMYIYSFYKFATLSETFKTFVLLTIFIICRSSKKQTSISDCLLFMCVIFKYFSNTEAKKIII